ncbi:MAG: hypothetical protein RLZZ459_1363, partial [Cyanobacteriota bacterium]
MPSRLSDRLGRGQGPASLRWIGLLCGLAIALVLGWSPAPALALDTAAGVGLQERALFQDTVDYTLTNQSGKDFSGQQLENTSFA